jgi:hypothetical protein
MADLTSEQKTIIRAIEKQAIAMGVDPDFALAVAGAESNYKHIPANDPKSTAYGPFQVNKATAEFHKYKYPEMVADANMAIEAGLKNLHHHGSNPLFENDPARITAAHRWGAGTSDISKNPPGSNYARTGDRSYLAPDMANYIADIGERHPNGEFPQSILTNPAQNTSSENTSLEKTEDDQSSSEYGGTKVGGYKDPVVEKLSQTDPAETGAIAGAIGAVGGTTYLTKKPVIGVMQKFGMLPGGPKVSDLPIESQVLSRDSLQRYTNSQLGVKVLLSDLEKLTGGTPLRTMREVQQAIDKLHAVDEIPASREPRFKYVDGQKIRTGYNQIPAVPGKPQISLDPYIIPPTAQEFISEKLAKSPLGGAVKTMGETLKSSPVRGGLTAFSTGLNAQDTANKIETGDKTGAALSGIATGADIASLFPKVGPLAGTVSAAIDAQRRAHKKDYIGALTSGLGALAPYAAPFVFGPQVGIPAGIATAVGAPFANELKDYLMRQYGSKQEAKSSE